MIRTARYLRLIESQTFVSLTPSFGGRPSVFIESRLRVLDEIAPLAAGLAAGARLGADAARAGGVAAARFGAQVARFGGRALRAARPVIQRGLQQGAQFAKQVGQRGGQLAKQFGQRFGKAMSSARSAIAKKAPEIIAKTKRLARVAKVNLKRAVGRDARSSFKLLSGRGTLRAGAPQQIQRFAKKVRSSFKLLSGRGTLRAGAPQQIQRVAKKLKIGQKFDLKDAETKDAAKPKNHEPEPDDGGPESAPKVQPTADRGKDRKGGSTHGSAGLPVVGIKDKCPSPYTKTSAFGGYRSRGKKRCSPQTQPRKH